MERPTHGETPEQEAARVGNYFRAPEADRYVMRVTLRMDQLAEQAKHALDSGEDALFDSAQAEMHALRTEFPEAHEEWLKTVFY